MHRPGVGLCILFLSISINVRAQSVYDAERGSAFSRVSLGATVSTLGIGVHSGTNLAPKIDLRVFGNYTNLTHNFTRSGFRIDLNVGMANFGGKVDVYPLRRIPLRISPGYLFFNSNGIRASLHAEKNATFTINNVQYASDNANPVYGTGRLELGGSGFMITAGLGHFVSHTYKRLTFPFEAGAAFINRPVAQFNLYGTVCSTEVAGLCQPAAQFPAFATNMDAQVKSWNQRVAPFHIYPIVEGGVAYSFSWRRRPGVY